MTLRPLELLAPARNAEVARRAIAHGADAIYIGASEFGARSAATNTIAEIAAVVEDAHHFGVKVYVTVNTIVYDHELPEVERLIKSLYRAGVDALIVQDLGLLRLDIPPIELHASTQCDIRTPQKAAFLESLGFSQLVLPRELSLDEIAAVRKSTSVPLEGFVHGALCVSYSGDCQASWATCGRSANRGECAQICRHAFDLYSGDSTEPAIKGKYLLSLRDLYRADSLEAMADAGISSFKIEGRLKDSAYVQNIVALYRRRLDALIEAHPDRWCHASDGDITLRFTPDAYRSFNRGFTPYFMHGRPDCSVKMASVDTPKSRGREVGVIKGVADHGRVITASLSTVLANGDGLGYFSPDGNFVGFRLNRVDGNRLYPARPINPAVGTTLWRNSDKAFDDHMSEDTSSRTIPVTMTLRMTHHAVALDITDDSGHCATATVSSINFDKARTPQLDYRRRTLERLGDSCFSLRELNDRLGNSFIPASVLTELRRRAVNRLTRVRAITFCRPLRRREDIKAPCHVTSLTRHDNVANHLSAKLYRDHGATIQSMATECTASLESNPVVMTTRYCLRRELGACLRQHGGDRLPEPLTLVSGNFKLCPTFDCKNCRMLLHLCTNPTGV